VLPSASVTLGILTGDINGDGAVNGRDIDELAADRGQATNETNFRADLDADGVRALTLVKGSEHGEFQRQDRRANRTLARLSSAGSAFASGPQCERKAVVPRNELPKAAT